LFPARKSGKKEGVWVVFLHLFLLGSDYGQSKILELITQAKPILGTRYGVTRLALFGSFARETDHSGSDIDILVDFDGKVDADRYFGVLFFFGGFV
jgi:hypothetical protein